MIKQKLIAFAVIFALFSGLCVGYATLTDNLTILGSAHVEGKPFEGVYIYEVEFVSASDAVALDHTYVHPTNFGCLASTSRPGSVTYKITVHNNSDITYWYLRQ
ncbi:MAG: hypothetical protein E7587_10245, partial [Ruminococcaceae bacterium]|nr:hypothetical protein [Oscillospiraceae bacterium]